MTPFLAEAIGGGIGAIAFAFVGLCIIRAVQAIFGRRGAILPRNALGKWAFFIGFFVVGFIATLARLGYFAPDIPDRESMVRSFERGCVQSTSALPEYSEAFAATYCECVVRELTDTSGSLYGLSSEIGLFDPQAWAERMESGPTREEIEGELRDRFIRSEEFLPVSMGCARQAASE